MKTAPAAAIALLVFCVSSFADSKLRVMVDPRVELVSIVFRLAGNPEYSMDNSSSPYADAVEQHFGKFRDHEAVKMARELRRTNGVRYDAVMSFAVHLSPTMPPKFKMTTTPRPPLLEQRWKGDSADRFVKALAQFAADTGFEKFFAENRDRFEKSAEKVSQIVNRRDYVGWFDGFFGQRPKASFTVIVGMLEGGGNYGVSTRDHDGNEEITPVIGIYKWDAEGLPAVGDEMAPTIVHEFCHGYTNAIVDAHANQLDAAGKVLFERNPEVMRRQAYGNGRTLLYESFVRACVTYYMQTEVSANAGKAQAIQEMGRGFKWTKEFAALLGDYAGHRDQYKTFDDFIPRVVEFLNDTAKNYDALLAKFPKIVSIVPANGAKNVDPATQQIVITFDRPMQDKSWSIVGGGPEFPTLGTPSYDAAHEVLTVPVTLEPGKSYKFGLNGGRFFAFLSEQGYPLEAVQVVFTTK